MIFIDRYFREAKEIIDTIDTNQIRKMVDLLVNLRKQKGRLFILGVGGGAGNASHAVNDFRKICGIESYAPTDNVYVKIPVTNTKAEPCYDLINRQSNALAEQYAKRT